MRLRPITDKTDYDYEVALMLPGFYEETAVPEYFTKNTFGIWDHEIIEVMCHPAFVDQRLLDISSYSMQRARELQTIRDPELKQWINENQIELITFADLKKVEKMPVEEATEEETKEETVEETPEVIEETQDIENEIREAISSIDEENIVEELVEDENNLA